MSKIRTFKKEELEDCPKYTKIKELGLQYAGLKSIFPYINVWYQIKQFHLFRTLGDAVKSFFLWIKYRRQRLKYGISEYDCFSLDTYMEVVFKNAIKMLNNGRWSYPATMTDEEWEEKLQWLITRLEFITDDGYDSEYYHRYEETRKKCNNQDCEELKEAGKEWYDYTNHIEALKVEARNEVFDFLKEHWMDLWD